MAKFRSTKNKFRKAAIATLCAVTVACTSLAAACQDNGGGSSDSDKTRGEDSQLLGNGNFEFFNVPDDATYLIKNVQDWSRSGDSSGSMSGILDTSVKNWSDITAPGLADELNKNNDLPTSNSSYKDYNGMKSADIPYKDTYAATRDATFTTASDGTRTPDSILFKNDLTYAEFLGITVIAGENDDPDTYEYGEGDDAVPVYYDEDTQDYYFDTDYTQLVRKDVIKNPETHWGSYRYDDATGKHYLGEGTEKEIFLDDDGYYYSDEAMEYSEGNVLMIHNYPTDTKYNGIQQYYSSSTVTLEARTAAKISVWVKTSDLKFDKGYSLLDEQDRGAYIEVIQTVGGTTIDAFTIKAINTQKIINDNPSLNGNNGWLQYNIYVNSCDFASSTVQLRLGLGKSNGEACTGYAFFDDVTVEKELDLSKTDYDEENDNGVIPSEEIVENDTYCTLSDEGDDKIFYADKAVRGTVDERHSTHFNYLIDLGSTSGAADGVDHYSHVELNSDNVQAGLTTEKDDDNTYASAESYEGKYPNLNQPTGTYDLYKKTAARPTESDLLGLFSAGENFDGTGINATYAKALTDALLGEKTSFTNLPNGATSKMLVMLSVWGAAYTSTISDSSFTLQKDEQMIVSFWVKTYEMKDHEAATIIIYDADDEDKENVQKLELDTSDIKTDIGDEKDIYNGWVQCFFFVKNETKGEKTFKIDFCFGNTSIISATSYAPGWAAIANIQTLKISEEVYKLNASASFTKKFELTKEIDEKSHNKFAEALGTYDIESEISQPTGYNGVNGKSSSVSDSGYSHNYDVWNTDHEAGLINMDNFIGDDDATINWQGILSKFASDFSATTKWSDVFGDDCYQPLIIVNNLRRYADKATITKDIFDTRAERGVTYYVLDDDGEITDNNDRRYRKVEDNEEFKDDETYYTIQEVVNYGFVGENKTLSSNSTQTISVRVMVTGGATAYIYLVDATTREVMGYSLPEYTFWYDIDGNVIDEEYDEEWEKDGGKDREKHIIYEKQENGLYKDKDEGNYVANLYNLKKIYQKDKYETYYTKDGDVYTQYKGAKFKEGVDYYIEVDGEKVIAPHRLCNSDDQPIYEYKGVNSDGKEEYYYIVKGKVSGTVVTAFDTEKAPARYAYTDGALDDAKYCIKVEDTNYEWVTVNFVVQTGSESKSYRLELWSGERDKTGADGDLATEDAVSGAIAFDYSAYSITSSNYSTVTDYYQGEIISAYQDLLVGHESEFENDFTVEDYEKLANEVLGEEDTDLQNLKKTYSAHYYAYSLYFSEVFKPFNNDSHADDETDYEYTPTDSVEELAFFYNEVKDSSGTSYNMFINYSVVEQSVNRQSSSSNDTTTDGGDDNSANPGDFWLQLASIILVVVLLFVLLVLVARIIIKRIIRKKKIKDQSKNVYRKRERYLRKLHIETEETEEIDNPALQNDQTAETPAEEVTEEAPAEKTETPAEEVKEESPTETTETPAEEVKEESPTETTETPVEEVKEESPTEAPVEEKPAETTETPSENPEDKPE